MNTADRVTKYFNQSFLSDLKAGFTTAIVALPLAIAFAIASGVEPAMGLYTAIIAGTLVSLNGGSKFSVTGPTGAMTVIILSTVNNFGVEGLLLAGFLAGMFQILFGLLKLGTVVKYIPLPVISGFTSGIGAIILIGQIPNSLGLEIQAKEHVWDTIYDTYINFGTVNTTAVLIFFGTLFLLTILPTIFSRIKHLTNVPSSIATLIFIVITIYYLHIDVPTVGDIPSSIPKLQFLNFNSSLVYAVLPAALTIALLGMIEALLCAVVCDAMTNTKHNSNKELVGQGIANMVVPLFSGIPATAAIARSAVNIREGAKTNISGIIHALILLIILMFLGPIAKFIPISYLAGVLVLVSFKMINIEELVTTMRISKMDTSVLVVTFALTVFTNLIFAVQMGMLLSMILLFVRLTNIVDIQSIENYDKSEGINYTIFSDPYLENNVSVYTINGPFFFGAMNVFENKIDEHMKMSKQHIIIRMRYVPFIDSTGIERLKSFILARKKMKQSVYLTSVQPNLLNTILSDKNLSDLIQNGVVNVFESTQEALNHLKSRGRDENRSGT